VSSSSDQNEASNRCRKSSAWEASASASPSSPNARATALACAGVSATSRVKVPSISSQARQMPPSASRCANPPARVARPAARGEAPAQVLADAHRVLDHAQGFREDARVDALQHVALHAVRRLAANRERVVDVPAAEALDRARRACQAEGLRRGLGARGERIGRAGRRAHSPAERLATSRAIAARPER
jgi:hypothetical protein